MESGGCTTTTTTTTTSCSSCSCSLPSLPTWLWNSKTEEWWTVLAPVYAPLGFCKTTSFSVSSVTPTVTLSGPRYRASTSPEWKKGGGGREWRLLVVLGKRKS